MALLLRLLCRLKENKRCFHVWIAQMVCNNKQMTLLAGFIGGNVYSMICFHHSHTILTIIDNSILEE